MRFAEVAVDAPAGHDRTFSYSIPPSLAVRPGHLVRVPFGSRTLQGLVFSLTSVPQVPETRELLGIASEGPFLSEAQLCLSRWISRYYMCPLFEAAAPMLPPGGRVRSRSYLSLSSDVDSVEGQPLAALEQRVLEYIRPRGVVEHERLIRALGQRAGAAVRRLVGKNVLVSSSGRTRPVGPKYRSYVTLSLDAREALRDWLPAAAGRAPRQAALVTRLLENDAPLDLTEARKRYGPSAVSALLARGWIESERLPVERDPLAGKHFPPAQAIALTARQAATASEIRAALKGASAGPRSFLIHGVTGSGKTEIYMDAVECCQALGKRAIVLVPEIALTHQTVEWFGARFPGQVAVLHSRLSMGERFDQWWKIKRGAFKVVIGSRSAIFAPQPDLGLIVVDEEHEWTYKQHDANPRYHARDVALRLAEITGAVVVMGSASPDVGSFHRGLRKGFRLLTLPERVLGDAGSASPSPKIVTLPPVEVVDMRRELREGNRDIFSRALLAAMSECLRAGRQMILFLNRRGSASYMLCRTCGSTLRCRRCDVALTYHREADRLICHFCGYRRIAPAKCPKCLSYQLSYYGAGTEAVAQQVARRFPEANIMRWDADVTRSAREYGGLLARFRAGEAQVLVGTQMIAKGLHFPSVTLVGVVSADVGLNVPDYRSGERSFQVLYQVAGRAGRGQAGGRVIIQTYQPDNYAVQAAAAQDYRRFYNREIAFRREQSNPPFGKLIRLLYVHANRALCEREAMRLAHLLRTERDARAYSDIELLGPTPAYPARLRGRYRWHLIMRAPEPRMLLDQVPVGPGWIVDIDPVTLT